MVGLFGGAAKFPLPAIVTEAKQIAGIYAGSLEHLRQLVKTFTSHKVFLLFCSTLNLQKCLLIAEFFGKIVFDGRLAGGIDVNHCCNHCSTFLWKPQITVNQLLNKFKTRNFLSLYPLLWSCTKEQ